jgi:hypothetical protein
MSVLSGLLLAFFHIYIYKRRYSALCLLQYSDESVWNCLESTVFNIIAYLYRHVPVARCLMSVYGVLHATFIGLESLTVGLTPLRIGAYSAVCVVNVSRTGAGLP